MSNWLQLQKAPNRAMTATFGLAVTYTPASTGVAESLDAPFDDRYERIEVDSDGYPVSTTTAMMEIDDDDLSVDPAVGDAVTVASTSYTVGEIQRRGHGTTRLFLVRAS